MIDSGEEVVPIPPVSVNDTIIGWLGKVRHFQYLQPISGTCSRYPVPAADVKIYKILHTFVILQPQRL